MENNRKANKQHTCGCGSLINKGEHYLHVQIKLARFDKHDIQIGIEYYNDRFCKKCLTQMTCNHEEKTTIESN